MAARGCYYPCYFAVGSVCRCPCGGANHNCGREGAPPRQAVVGGQMLAPAPVSVDLVPVETGEFGNGGGVAEATGGSAAGLADWDTEGPDGFLTSEGLDDGSDWEPSVTPGEEQERFDAVLAAQRESAAASALGKRAVTDRMALPGSVNEVEQVTLDDGSNAYLKPVEQDDAEAELAMYGVTAGEQATHEAAAYHLAEAMGDRYQRLVATTAIVNDDEHGASVLSAGRDGRSGGEWAFTPAGWAGEANSADVRDAAFFDAVCGNRDRHPGNFLVADDGSVSLIDHGFAFGALGDESNQAVIQRRRDLTGHAVLVRHERATLQRLSESPNLLGVAPMIGAQRADAMRGRIEGMLDSGLVPPE